MSEIKLFEKEEFGKLRVILCNGEPWFVGSEVATALGYDNPANAVNVHCKKANKITLSPDLGGREASVKMPPVMVNIIPESDVYRLIMRSNLPNAEKFQDWVVEEVLPSIRKTGAYATNNALTMPNFSNPAEAARAWADEYEAKQRSALILLKRMRKPPFLDRFGGFALSRGCPDPELIAVSAGSFNEANVLEPHRR